MQPKFLFSAKKLKELAMLSMLVDHAGKVLAPGLLWPICVGRLAFCCFSFLLAVGFFHTRNPWDYWKRLFLLAVASELPFRLLFNNGGLLQNVGWTLCFSLALLMVLEQGRKAERGPVFFVALCLLFFALGQWVGCDYGGAGILLGALFFYTKEETFWPVRFLGLVCFSLWTSKAPLFAAFQTASLVPISLYQDSPPPKSKLWRWGTYLFYPVHLWILFFVSRLFSFHG